MENGTRDFERRFIESREGMARSRPWQLHFSVNPGRQKWSETRSVKKTEMRCVLDAFVVMPNHVHALVQPQPRGDYRLSLGYSAVVEDVYGEGY